jgi:hypothetical protein
MYKLNTQILESFIYKEGSNKIMSSPFEYDISNPMICTIFEETQKVFYYPLVISCELVWLELIHCQSLKVCRGGI